MSAVCLLRFGVLLALLAGAVSCERKETPLADSHTNEPPSPSPRATIEQLIAARDRAAYQRIEELVVPDRARQVTPLLMAVDDFLHANDALCGHVRTRLTIGLSQTIDQSHWGSRLDVFSTYVDLVDEHVDGNKASVSFIVGGQLPLRRAQLRLLNGQWRYDPGAGFDPRLVEAFSEMARGMRLVLSDLKSGRLAEADVRADPALLVEEVRVRLSKGVRLFPRAPTTQPTDSAAP